MALSDAERQRLRRDRQRGGPPRTPKDDALARARRAIAAGLRRDELAPDELAALRQYQAERKANAS